MPDLRSLHRLARCRLHQAFGYPDFRPAQRPVIHAVLAGHDVLAVLPTGGGKSVCFQVPAMVLPGLTVVVSPLIALMQDQVDAARRRGMAAEALHSALDADTQRSVIARARGGDLDLLYLSPERLYRLTSGPEPAGFSPGLLAVDEAHCISEWGPDFRPDYRRIAEARRRFGSPSTVALTGSATPAVRQDIIDSLGLGTSRRLVVRVASFDRPNLCFEVVSVRDDVARFGALLDTLRGAITAKGRERGRGTGAGDVALVYAPTRNLTEAIARHLRHAGYRAAAYHAGLADTVRREVLDAFLADRYDVIAATSAFGMGIDKPNVRTVVHWRMPMTPESYYQEAGRAGRDGAPSRCVLLYRAGDAASAKRMLDVTFPPERLVVRVATRPNGRVGVPHDVLESAVRLAREVGLPTPEPDWTAVRRRRREAESRVAAMRRYAETKGCRRAVLLAWFGETGVTCRGCDRCQP